MFKKCRVLSELLALCTFVFLTLFVRHILLAEDIPAPVFEKTLHNNEFTPTLMVSTSFDARMLKRFGALGANVGAEVWRSFTLEGVNTSSVQTEQDKDSAVLNTLFNVRSLEGTQYYSHRRKRYREFIIKSYTIDSLKNKNRIDDILYSIYKPRLLRKNGNYISVYELLWFRQDSSFGSGILEYIVFYNKQAHEFYIDMQNLQSIRYKNVLPLAKPRSMALGVIIKRKGDTYSTYAVSGIKTSDAHFKSLRQRVGISLMYRLYATITWFEKTLKEHYARVK